MHNHLLASQRAALDDALRLSGLPVLEFTWVNRDGEWFGLLSDTSPCIQHRDGFYCVFGSTPPDFRKYAFPQTGHPAYGDHHLLMSPGIESRSQKEQFLDWAAVLTWFIKWLSLVARETGRELLYSIVNWVPSAEPAEAENDAPPVRLPETVAEDGGAIPKHIILLLHGIRTSASWAEMVRRELEGPPGVLVLPIRYGYLDLFSFLLPGPTRSGPVSRILREIRTVRATHPHAKISVLAHSFGTYAVTRILRDEGDVSFHRLLLCGSIVPSTFRWDLVRGRLGDKPVNDCGVADIWPLFAKSATWGYGASGVEGFGSVVVTDRYHPFGHSQYFDPAFVRDYWGSYLLDGNVRRPPYEAQRPPLSPWRHLLSRVPIQWLFVGAILIGGALAAKPAVDRALRRGTLQAPAAKPDSVGTSKEDTSDKREAGGPDQTDLGPKIESTTVEPSPMTAAFWNRLRAKRDSAISTIDTARTRLARYDAWLSAERRELAQLQRSAAKAVDLIDALEAKCAAHADTSCDRLLARIGVPKLPHSLPDALAAFGYPDTSVRESEAKGNARDQYYATYGPKRSVAMAAEILAVDRAEFPNVPRYSGAQLVSLAVSDRTLNFTDVPRGLWASVIDGLISGLTAPLYANPGSSEKWQDNELYAAADAIKEFANMPGSCVTERQWKALRSAFAAAQTTDGRVRSATRDSVTKVRMRFEREEHASAATRPALCR